MFQMTENMFCSRMTDLLERINAMRSQEDKAQMHDVYHFSSRRGSAYNSHPINKECRKAMAEWCFSVADVFSVSRETVGIAMTFLDRYVSSGKRKSQEALQSHHTFQLAAVTSLYIAVKVFEPIQMDIDLLVKMCRGLYSEPEILSMERDILFSLNWRVSGPTPLDFARHFLQIIAESAQSETIDSILQCTQRYMDRAVTDAHFSGRKPSTLALACLLCSLNEAEFLLQSDQTVYLFWMLQISGFDTSSNEILELQQRLASGASPRKEKAKPFANASLSNNTAATYNSGSKESSPVCVSHAAFQRY